jgi:hypothetical protein
MLRINDFLAVAIAAAKAEQDTLSHVDSAPMRVNVRDTVLPASLVESWPSIPLHVSVNIDSRHVVDLVNDKTAEAD